MDKTWYKRAVPGIFGALSLCVLRALGAGFYIGQRHEIVLGALLILAAYLFLALAYCTFHLDAETKTKDAFIAGFLAPSILIALFNSNYPKFDKEVGTSSVESVQEVDSSFFQKIDLLPFAHADEVNQNDTVKVIDLKSLRPSVVDGMMLELYRAPIRKQYLIVIARGKNLEKVTKKAKEISLTLAGKNQVTVVKGVSENYITLGQPLGSNEAANYHSGMRETADMKASSTATKATLNFINNAQLVEVNALLDKR